MDSGFMSYPVKDGKARAYFSNPEGRRIAGQVIVIHEVWGFTSFVKEACERLSRQGLRAVAPLLYWRHSDLFTESTIREGLRAIWGLSLEERRVPARLDGAIRKGRPSGEAASMLRILYDRNFRSLLSRDLLSLARSLHLQRADLRVGALGFSMGGKLALQLGANFPSLAATVAVSSEPLVGPSLAKVRSPMLLIYGSEDGFMLRNLPAFVAEAIEKGKEFELKVYPSAGHEFFDHTDKKEFRADAAKGAWKTATLFLKNELSQG